VSNDIEALFGDSSNDDAAMSAMMDEQVALLASFKTAHREQVTRQFMAAEREALATMLVVRTKAAREAARVTKEIVAMVVVARDAARAEELAEEEAPSATAREEMARDRCRWDKDMAPARRAREIHELANERRHRLRLARRQGRHDRQTDSEGSNAIDAGERIV
jgi:hypothetical protein